jgi:hypothetical protein
MNLPRQDIQTLRNLACRVAEIAEDEHNLEKAALWSRLTDLDTSVRPLLLTHLWPLAWSQVLPDETALTCTHPDARRYERDLRERLWMAQELNHDWVLEPVAHYPHCVSINRYGGLSVDKVYAPGDFSQTGAAHFEPEIVDKSDLDRLGDPVVSVDWEARSRHRAQTEAIFDGILDVVPDGLYFAAKVIDEWVALRGMGQFYLDVVEDPGWTHEALQRLADNIRSRFLQCEELGIWGPWEGSDPLGSTGLRFNPDLPDYREIQARGTMRLDESWGFTCAEAFTCVSPQMHDEFAFTYDRQLMPLFRHVNVGCCEVLSDRIDRVRSIPNARRITVSEWADLERAAEAMGAACVYGYKPSGVPFISDPWDPELVRREIRSVLECTRGCAVEIILNIGGTLGGDAARQLVEWNEIAMGEILAFQRR